MTRNQTPTRPRRAPAPHKPSAPNKDTGPRAGDDDAEFIQWELETLRPPTQRRVHSSGERRVTVTKPAPTYAPADTSGVSETDDGNARFRRELHLLAVRKKSSSKLNSGSKLTGSTTRTSASVGRAGGRAHGYAAYRERTEPPPLLPPLLPPSSNSLTPTPPRAQPTTLSSSVTRRPTRLKATASDSYSSGQASRTIPIVSRPGSAPPSLTEDADSCTQEMGSLHEVGYLREVDSLQPTPTPERTSDERTSRSPPPPRPQAPTPGSEASTLTSRASRDLRWRGPGPKREGVNVVRRAVSPARSRAEILRKKSTVELSRKRSTAELPSKQSTDWTRTELSRKRSTGTGLARTRASGLTRSRSADMRKVAAVSAGGLPSIPDETNFGGRTMSPANRTETIPVYHTETVPPSRWEANRSETVPLSRWEAVSRSVTPISRPCTPPTRPTTPSARSRTMRGPDDVRTMRGSEGSCKLERSASFVELGDVSDDGRRKLTCQESKDLFRRMWTEKHTGFERGRRIGMAG
ncbi:hypothetical protein EV122DRAFT_216721 [Schizophyllum commune]